MTGFPPTPEDDMGQIDQADFMDQGPYDGMEEQPTQQTEPVPPEQINLAESLDEEELKKIAAKVIEDVRQDLDSRSEWEAKHAKWIELYYQNDKAKNPPWDGASEESLPILTEAINQFQSRSYKAFFPTRYFVDCIPVGQSNPEARQRAERIGKHMSYQLGVLDRTYKLNKAQMFMATALHGSDFTKTYFSPIKKRTIIERVRALDFVVPYGVGPRNIDDLERKTHIKYMSLNDTRILKELGWFVDEGKPSSSYDDSGTETNEAVDDAEGLSNAGNYRENESQCKIYEQHCLLDLDEDGIAEPYIVWVDVQSSKVLRLQIRYEVDETGLPTKDKEPIEYFTHYQFLPNPDGFYGLGYGHLLGQQNIAANKLQRMFIDANELSVVGNLTFLISEQLGLKGDDFELSIGRGVKIPRSVEDIKKHFTKLDFEPPSQETLQMLNSIQEDARRISANSDILSGQPDKVYQPTAMMSMIEQGLQLLSSVQEFQGYAMEDELQKVYRLNAKYLTEDQNFIDGDKQITVTREDYQDDFRVVPIFDPKYSTRSQRLAKAQAEWEFVLNNPLMGQNPNSLYLSSRNYLEALDTENIDEILPKPAESKPARIDDQRLENAYFIMPPDRRPLFDVFPDQDHIKHTQMIDQMIEWVDQAHPMDVPNPPMGDPQISNLISKLGNDQKQELIANLLRHRSLHVAYMYGQLNGVMDAQGQPTTGVTDEQGQPIGTGSTEQLAAPSDDAEGIRAIMSALASGQGTEDVPTG